MTRRAKLAPQAPQAAAGSAEGSSSSSSSTPPDIATLPLFPLATVLFPGGQLPLKIFEARYLDMISNCLRSGSPFGVVCLNEGGEVGRSETMNFEPLGVLAHLQEVDAESAGILTVACSGGARFSLQSARLQADGLWLGEGIRLLAGDPVVPPGEAYAGTVYALSQAIATLDIRDPGMFPAERRLDDAGWVANRWCELLPIPLAARQKLMALEDPLMRLSLVDDFLRQQRVIN